MEADLIVTVIPNWNLKNDLKECLVSLLDGIDPSQEIVVVDNGSKDGSVEMVRDEFPQVTLLQETKNLGYAGALNTGFRYALQRGAAYVFGLNNDTVIPAGAVRRLANLVSRNPRLGLVSPKVLYFQEPWRLFSLGARIFRWLPLPVEFGRRWRDRPCYRRLIRYDYVTGCAFLVPASVLRRVGLMNTAYFMHYEDLDFCQRIREAGYQIGMDGETTIFHKVSQSLNQDRSASIRRRFRNKVWFFRQHSPGPARWLTDLALLGSAYIQAFKLTLSGQPSYAKALLAGHWEGWNNPSPRPEGTQIIEEDSA